MILRGKDRQSCRTQAPLCLVSEPVKAEKKGTLSEMAEQAVDKEL